jgi:8-oxo-dGTP diphosphatase
MADKAFYESLPSKRMGAGCVFFNIDGKVLLVKPTYKDGWEIPGGAVEGNESPKSSCEREVLEEMGLEVSVKRLLIVDYNSYPQETHKTESLMFIFDGGVLSDNELAAINLSEDEISGWQFFSIDHLPKEMNHSLRNRIIQAVEQKKNHCTAYLENQQTV